MERWAHQTRCLEETTSAIVAGERRICVTTPTGGGKTLEMQDLAQHYLTKGKKVVLYTNRKLLIEQTSQALLDAGLYHGIRAAGYEQEHDHPFQVSSIQTEHARVTKRKVWDLHDADLVLLDECHVQVGPSVKTILDAHYEAGASIVGFTATPLDLEGMYETLIVAGTNTELLECGAIVPSWHFGPDEPDMKAFKKLREGEDPSQPQQKLAMMTPSIFGRVSRYYHELNPEGKPTVLFGPGVNEALWFAEQFSRHGVPAAHIDGADVWLDGKLRSNDESARAAVRDGSQSGDIKVVCNRYVLREGVNWPWIGHMILAFVAGNLKTYLQTGGRGLRAFAGKTHLSVQDHGGAWWRHGSLNEDRAWTLGLTSAMAAGLRADRMREKRLKEPFRCPQCGRVWIAGKLCNPARGGCGYAIENVKHSRPVVSTDGTMKEHTGDIFRRRRIYSQPNGQAIWERMYWRSRTDKGSRSFRAAMALFAQENNWGWPSKDWPFMPTKELDFYRLVKDVPMHDLVSKQSFIPQGV